MIEELATRLFFFIEYWCTVRSRIFHLPVCDDVTFAYEGL